MNKNLKNITKMLLIPTLVIGALSACGYNQGPRTTNYDGVRPYTYDGTRAYNYDGVRPYAYDGVRPYNYDGVRPYAFDGVRPYNYDGVRPYANDGVRPYNYDGARPYAYNGVRPFTNNNRVERVARISADLADSVLGVNKATAVVSGNDIVIGIDVNKGSNLKAVERNVHQKVKAKEPSYNVHVTSDARLHSRIRAVHDNINNYNTNTATPGHPVRNLGRDIGDIIRDIGRTVTAPFR